MWVHLLFLIICDLRMILSADINIRKPYNLLRLTIAAEIVQQLLSNACSLSGLYCYRAVWLEAALLLGNLRELTKCRSR